MKRIKKLMSILLVLGMLATQLVIPQIASAELAEEEIYFEDFNSVTSEQKTAWHETYDAATATPGQWYLYSGNVYTHNLALGNVSGQTKEKRMPIPFGTTLDIVNNKYELTFRLNHVQNMDTVLITSVHNSKGSGYGLSVNSEDKVRVSGTNVYDWKVVIESQKFTIYRKTTTETDYTSLGSRTVTGTTLDGLVLQMLADTNESIHAIDDICVKQIDKSTGDVLTTVYSENFDDWTYEGDGKSIVTNINSQTDFYDRFVDYTREARLIPMTYGNDDGLIGYIQKPGHTTNGNGVDNYMRFVFPEILDSGKYVISFDWSNAKKSCDYIYLHDTDGNSATIVDGNNSYAAKGFRNIKIAIDMDARTYQINDGTVNTFADGTFVNGAKRILFRQHLDAGTGKTTLIDNFKIVKLVEKSLTISDKDIVITNSEGFAQINTQSVDVNLGNITVNFAKALDETTVTKENVVLSGGINPDYNVKYENNQIIVSLVSGKLELGTDYTLSINNVMAEGEIPVLTKEFSFKTNDAEFVRTQLYSEDFNNVSDDTLASWNDDYSVDTAVKGQWYSRNTTPALVENTNVNDKALSTSAHVSGTQDYLYFKLPGNITSDGISRYEISFDYYAYGEWCDWFYLRNGSDVASYMNMDFTNGWHTVAMTIDLVNQAWTVNGAKCSHENILSTLDKTDLTFALRLHGNAAADSVIKVDNFKVYKLSEKYELSKDTFTISESSFTAEADKTTASVKLTVNKSGVYNFTAFIAAYESDHTMQNVVSVPVSTNFSDTIKVIEGLSIATDSKTDYCKVFIWDMAEGNLIPLTESISSK